MQRRCGDQILGICAAVPVAAHRCYLVRRTAQCDSHRMCKEASISQDVAGGVGGLQQRCPLPGSVSDGRQCDGEPPSPDHGHMFLHSRDTSLVIARRATQATSSYRGQAVKYPSNMLNISSEQCIALQ